MDLFGEETEEEKKAAEERAAAVKASGKKKECEFFCGYCFSVKFLWLIIMQFGMLLNIFSDFWLVSTRVFCLCFI